MSVEIDIRNMVGPALARVSAAMKQGQLNTVAGRAGVNEVKEHYWQLERERPNAMGGTRTNFWAQCARSTNYTQLPDGVKVSVSQVGAAQRFYGGRIVPGPGKKYLTIPARAEAYGRRAKEFTNLHFEITEAGPALVQGYSSTIRRTKKGKSKLVSETDPGVMFWLRREVNQKGDPSTLPTPVDLAAAVLSEVNDYVERQMES